VKQEKVPEGLMGAPLVFNGGSSKSKTKFSLSLRTTATPRADKKYSGSVTFKVNNPKIAESTVPVLCANQSSYSDEPEEGAGNEVPAPAIKVLEGEAIGFLQTLGRDDEKGNPLSQVFSEFLSHGNVITKVTQSERVASKEREGWSVVTTTFLNRNRVNLEGRRGFTLIGGSVLTINEFTYDLNADVPSKIRTKLTLVKGK
jgi:hypothetical protein